MTTISSSIFYLLLYISNLIYLSMSQFMESDKEVEEVVKDVNIDKNLNNMKKIMRIKLR